MKNEKYFNMIWYEINTIQSEDIKTFAKNCLKNVQDYFFTIPASSSGKYHPKNDLGEGGLVRHSISVKKILEHILVPKIFYSEFSQREKDLLIVAALFHDSFKSGVLSDNYNDYSTSFYHPLYAYSFIIEMSVKYNFSYTDAKYIADAIISHMGEWNTDSHGENGSLPKPVTNAQKILHLADYLASRKDINVTIPDMKDSGKEDDDE